ncbi:MAG: hypothetical protein JRI75_00480 [Deltaproteobacteria bacterium]|nr:hypothetical protein [Deltaproteobacteria bacterium]
MMKYTCADYRSEMTLLGLKKRLHQEELNEAEKRTLLLQIEELEAAMALD